MLECRKLLTDRNIERIAAAVTDACKTDHDTTSVKRLKAAIQEADTAIENLWKALESGQAADMITQRIEKRQREREDLEAQLAVEMGKQVTLTVPQIRAYLYSLKKGDINDENTKRGIINIFLRAVYLYDDRFTLILNGSERPVAIDDTLLDEIEEEFAPAQPGCGLCSPLVARPLHHFRRVFRLCTEKKSTGKTPFALRRFWGQLQPLRCAAESASVPAVDMKLGDARKRNLPLREFFAGERCGPSARATAVLRAF